MASEVNHHVGYSRENECWFVRFYPYQTEQQASEAAAAFTRPAPAATDTGLVTVEHQYWRDQTQEWLPTGFPDRYRKDGFQVRELVTQSQAEELLAAERADKRIWMEKAAIEAERVERLEAYNAAKDVRINFLERVTKDQETQITAQEALEAKLAAAEKALEAIEDHAARCFSLSTHSTIALAYLQDIQDEARAVLGGKPS